MLKEADQFDKKLKFIRQQQVTNKDIKSNNS